MQQPRQQYGLGSLVKKAVRGVKKIVKSPIGKAAIIGGLGMWGMGAGPFSSLKGAGWLKGLGAKSMMNMGPLRGTAAGKGWLGKMAGGVGNWWGGLSGGQKLFTGLAGASLALPFLMKDDKEEVEEESWTKVPSSIADIRNQARNYYNDPGSSTLAFMPGKQFVQPNFYAADGGRARLAPGGPAGGASAGGNYGGNVNPDQEYAGNTFEETYGGGNNNNTVVVNDTITKTIPEPVIKEGYNWKNIFPGGKPFYASNYTDYENVFGTQYDPITGAEITEDDSELVDNIRNVPELKKNISSTNEILANLVANESTLAQGGRVGLLNGGEAGQEQIEQMLMAEYVKYKNQGGTLSFEEFVQVVMQQQQEQQGGGMEQPQEVAMAANGGRIGFKSGTRKDDYKVTYKSVSEGGPEGWRTHDSFYDNFGKYLTPYWYMEKLLKNRKADGGRIGAYAGGLMSEDEDEYAYNPQAAMHMYRRPGKQEGGIMETEVAEEMIDLGGKEKDYRETGGFVDLGGKERADDVPARLSKNEFVFTADAVRNAGGGDIDKGSEVMQNLMDNLEAGGEVSEESQGLEGAQAMYDQQQMLQSRIA